MIYSEQFEPSRPTIFISILIPLCTHILNNLSHVFKTHSEFTFVKPLLKTKTLLLFFVTIFFLEYPFKSKEKYELFPISIFMKTVIKLPVNLKSIDEVYKSLLVVRLKKNPSFEIISTIIHNFYSEFHKTLNLNVNISSKIRSKLETVSLVKEESTIVASSFTLKLQTYSVICFDDVT